MPVAGDTVVEPDETFTVSLTAGAWVAPSAITSPAATGTILNDDSAPPVSTGTPGNGGSTNPIVGYADGSTGQSATVHFNAADPGGPGYLQWQYIFSGTDTLAISTQADNVFIHGGDGTDAIQAHGGTNVLDGGLGSNFLTGGSGTDTFFTDARGTGVVWTTIRNFHAGDGATLWGFEEGVSSYYWENQIDGAPGSQGATLRANIVGGDGRTGNGIDASITFAGLSVDQGKALLHSTGSQPAGDYLYFTA